MDPNDILFKFFGNNDSLENFEFFFDFLQKALQEGRFKEQQLFYMTYISKIKTKLTTKSNFKYQNAKKFNK